MNYISYALKKLLKPKDIFFLTLAGIGDVAEEIQDPLRTVSSAYKNMYGFIPRRYKKHNFMQMVGRSLKTGDIEKVIKDGKIYLRLTSSGKEKIHREFPISNLTQKWNKKWIVVIFDISEKARNMRDRLRIKVQSIGFGMLQESVWISPLPIGKDIKEMIEAIGLRDNVFVMEVSGLIFGNPRELANKVWNLDKRGEELIDLKIELEKINQLIKVHNDRGKKREAKLYKLEEGKRVLMRNYLEILAQFPPLPQELLPRQTRLLPKSLQIAR